MSDALVFAEPEHLSLNERLCSSISLWSTQRKKPVFTQALAHGIDLSQVEAEDIETVRNPRWITTLGSLRYSDLFASGTSPLL